MKNFIEAKKSLKSNGYGHFHSVIDSKFIKNFKMSFFSILNSLTNNNLPTNLNNSALVEELNLIRKRNPKKLDAFFKTNKLTNAFNSLFFNHNLQLLISKILNISIHNIILSETQMRIDLPNNNLYSLVWHQDSPYYPQAKNGADSIVINIIVQNCFKDMGSVEIISGSHKNGMLKFVNDGKLNKAQQLKVQKKYLKDKSITIIEPKAGDVVIYDMNLVHRSGVNISNKARVSVIGRAFNPFSKNFTPYQYTNIQLIRE